MITYLKYIHVIKFKVQLNPISIEVLYKAIFVRRNEHTFRDKSCLAEIGNEFLKKTTMKKIYIKKEVRLYVNWMVHHIYGHICQQNHLSIYTQSLKRG